MNENDQRVNSEQHAEDKCPESARTDQSTTGDVEESASSSMASEEASASAPTGDKLEAILEQHRRWVESDGKEGVQADLGGTDLRGADLRGADLRGAMLNGVNLQGCKLHGADFSEAYLQNANLEGTCGLQVKNLKGANVSNATLPVPVAAFDGLRHVKDAAQYARKLFFTILATCVYCWLTIAMTTDAGLVTNRAESPLPIVGTSIPIVGFFWSAPLMLLVLYVYFHLQLQRLWEVLAKLPAVFPDGQPLDQKADPWLLIGLVRAYFAHLKEEHLPFFLLQRGIVRLVTWWVVPFTLACFAYRYLPRHEPVGTAFLLVITVVAAWLAISYDRNAAAVLQGVKLPAFKRKRTWKGWCVVAMLLVVGVALLPFIVDIGEHFPAANLEEANLKEADLRFASLERAKLFGADLRRARLSGANLREADLRYARLDSVDLRRAQLDSADFSGAYLNMDSFLSAQILRGARVDSVTAQLPRSRGVQVERYEDGGLPEDVMLPTTPMRFPPLEPVPGILYGEEAEPFLGIFHRRVMEPVPEILRGKRQR